MPEPLSAADEVFEAMHEVMHLFRARSRGAAEDDAPLSGMEARALAYFARHPGATLSDLVAYSGRDKSQVAKLVGTLREQGLLEARPDAVDRRQLRLRPTEAARALHLAMQQRLQQHARAALRGFGKKDCRQLLELLGRIRANLADADEPA